MTYSISMIAPAPNQQFTCRSGNSYTSDGNSYIGNVVGQDINDLEGANCLPVGKTALPWVTGRFYGAPAGTTPVALLTVASTLYAYPILVPNSVTLSALQVSVTTGQTGGKVEAGLYYDNGSGYPNNLVTGTDTGDLDGTATAVVGPTNLTVALHPGWYWVAIQAAASSTMPSVAGITAAYTDLFRLLGSDTAAHQLAAGSQAPCGIKKTSQTYAALPTTFPSGAALVLNAGVPLASLGV